MQIVHILLDDTGDILELGELMPVVLREHALGADYLMAKLAEILYFLFRMPAAIYLRRMRLRAETSYESRCLLLLLHHPLLILLAICRLWQRLPGILAHLIWIMLAVHGMIILNLELHALLRERFDNFEYLLVGNQGLSVPALNRGLAAAQAALDLSGVPRLRLQLPDALQAQGVPALGQKLRGTRPRVED